MVKRILTLKHLFLYILTQWLLAPYAVVTAHKLLPLTCSGSAYRYSIVIRGPAIRDIPEIPFKSGGKPNSLTPGRM